MNIVDIEEFIEHPIPVERDIAGLLFVDAKKPDLSQIRSNRKKAGKNSKGAKGGRSGKPARDKPRSSEPKQERHRDERNAAKIQTDTEPNVDRDSAEAKDAAQQAKIEELQAAEPRTKPRTPLRGRRGQQIPAVG